MNKVSLTLAAILALYFAGYWALIDKGVASYDPATDKFYTTSCRIAPWVRVLGEFSIYSPKHSIANIIYAPLGANEEWK